MAIRFVVLPGNHQIVFMPGGTVKKSIPEHIIEIAAQLFAEKGFAGVSLQEIATIAEVEYADISQRFKSISEIYGAVLESLFELYARSMSVAFEGSHNSLDNVESFARAFCTLHKQSPHLFKLFYRELLDPSVYFESIVLKNVRHVAYLSDTNIAKGVQKGIFKNGVNPAIATMLFVGMFHYYFLAKEQICGSLLPGGVSDEEYITLALNVFLRGLQEDA